MSDAGKREWRFYLDDMIVFTERILTYTDGFERAGQDDVPELLPMLEDLRNEVQ
jgi:hypothetical protein